MLGYLDVKIFSLRSENLLPRPHMVGHARRHSRGHAEGLVNPHELVPREVERQGRPKILQFLAEGVRQPGRAIEGCDAPAW